MGSEEEEILESVEEWNDDDELLLDIDKMWDVLHFVLTGVSTDHKDDNNPLSQAVLGITAVEELSDYLAYTEHDKLADIVAALEQFDMEQALESFDMAACKEAELYPNIWDYDEEEDVFPDDLFFSFYYDSLQVLLLAIPLLDKSHEGEANLLDLLTEIEY